MTTAPKRITACLLILASVFLFSCEYNNYKLALKPEGQKIGRTLTVQRMREPDTANGQGKPQPAPLPADQLAKLLHIYHGKQVPATQPNIHVFHTTFKTYPPADLGGGGIHLYADSLLGSASFYAERFRHSDDLVGQIDTIRTAAHRLAAVITAYAQQQLGKDPRWPKFRDFLTQQFPRDLQNIGVYCWLARCSVSDNDISARTTMARVALYLLEKKYVPRNEVAKFLGLAAEAENSWPNHSQMRFIQRLIARHMGVADNAAIPKSLDYLQNRQSVQKSFKTFKSSKALHRLIAHWTVGKKPATDILAAKGPSALFDDLETKLLWGNKDELAPKDNLRLSFALPGRPLYTNGHWDAKSKTLRLHATLGSGPTIPHFFYALWTMPNVKVQRAHFGRVVVKREKLMEYVCTVAALSPAQRQQWTALIKALSPKHTPLTRIAQFHFTGKAASGIGAQRAKALRGLFLH